MIRLLVIHGTGMERRGIDNIETFGTMTMADYTRAIEGFAAELQVHAEVFHAPNGDALIARLLPGSGATPDGVLINPANLTVGHPQVAEALRATGLPVFEVHVSNPAARGVVSSIAPGATGVVTGFGVGSYRLAMQGVRDLVLARRRAAGEAADPP